MTASDTPSLPAPKTMLRALLPLAIFAALLVVAGQLGGMKLVLLAGIGLFAGIALYHASFGFTAAWRRLDRKSVV